MSALRRIGHALAFVIGIAVSLWCAPALAQASPAAGAMREILVMVRHPADHYRPNGSYGGGYGDDVARSSRERLARGIAHQYGLKFVEGWPMPMIGVDCFVMVVPSDRSTADVAAEVSHNSKVAWAEPVQTYRTQGGASAAPNDPLYVAQPAARQWRLADLHQIATGRGMRVAVIDSGIQADHPDLAGQLIVNRNFVAGQSEVAEDHGTGVAGIIAAKPDNRLGIVGVAPGARLLGLRACWQERGAGAQTACDGLSLAKALYFATEQKADVINLSLTGPDEPAARVDQDGSSPRLGGRLCIRSIQSRWRLPGIGSRGCRRFRSVIGSISRASLQCARPRRADDGAGRTMVSGQWQLIRGGTRQRPGGAGQATEAVRGFEPGLRSRPRRRNRCLRNAGAGRRAL